MCIRDREGIEKDLGSGMIGGIGPVYAARLVAAFGEAVFELIEAEPTLLDSLSLLSHPARPPHRYSSSSLKGLFNPDYVERGDFHPLRRLGICPAMWSLVLMVGRSKRWRVPA